MMMKAVPSDEAQRAGAGGVRHSLVECDGGGGIGDAASRDAGRSRRPLAAAGLASADVPTIEFCGHLVEVHTESFVIGRMGDLVIGEENAFVHRHFLLLRREHGHWFLINLGRGLTATVGGIGGAQHAILGPGASLALTHARNRVRFVAGPTRYEFEIRVPPQPLQRMAPSDTGDMTAGRVPLTRDQHLLILALSEAVLRNGEPAVAAMPTSQAAAHRLGWTITKFNRKLDNVCHKLEKLGVRGVHGGVDALASQRRVRLVEHAVAAGLVTVDDLVLLEQVSHAAQRSADEPTTGSRR